MKKILSLLCVYVGLLSQVNAQQTQKVVIDKIVAQLGNQIVLKSDIENYISEIEHQQGQPNIPKLPPDADCGILKQSLMQKALVIQAQRDSLPVSEQDLNSQLDTRIRQYIQQFGSREVMESYWGKSIGQIKEDMRDPLKQQMFANQERGNIQKNVKITPVEVEDFYNKIPKDSLPFFESEMEIAQIVMHPKPTSEVDDYIVQQLLEYRKEVLSGARKFQDLARLYSQDPSVKENGGQFSINRQDKIWDPAFLSAAFKLKEGEISPAVKSQFGYHIIQMVSRVGDQAIVRHILLIPPISEDEIKEAKDSLTHVRQYILENRISFKGAVSLYSDDKEGKMSGGDIMNPQNGSTELTYDELPDPTLIPILKNMKVGDISEPEVFTDQSRTENNGKKAVRIIMLVSRSEPHKENLKDDYNIVSQQALQQKQTQVLDDWFKENIGSFYIKIDNSYVDHCPLLKDWMIESQKKAQQRF